MLSFEQLVENANQYLWLLMQSWYVVIPICVFLIFAARFVEKISVSLFGFLLGGFVVYPMLYDRFEKFREWVTGSELTQYVAFFVLGIICAIALYVLFKVFVFLVGFFVGGGVVYYLLDFLIKRFDVLSKTNQFIQQNWFVIMLGICAVFGIITGLLAVRKSSSVIAILSLLAASVILSIEAIGWIYFFLSKDQEKTTALFSSTVGLVALLVLSLVVFALGIYFNFSKRKRQQKAQTD
ncbi:hypothetical protein [Thermotoga profunda]|uniref:hypothetical protein n=1 Tax=Thermotoga profunda TaxID=1508420 RepID=UPI00059787DE|nr:hypothetical protein [Thermotoga profunda]